MHVWFFGNFSPGLNGFTAFQKPPERFITIILGRACSRSQIASIAASIELIFSPLQFLYCAIIKLPLSLLSSASSISLCEMGAERKLSAEVGLDQSTSETGKILPQVVFSCWKCCDSPPGTAVDVPQEQQMTPASASPSQQTQFSDLGTNSCPEIHSSRLVSAPAALPGLCAWNSLTKLRVWALSRSKSPFP